MKRLVMACSDTHTAPGLAATDPLVIMASTMQEHLRMKEETQCQLNPKVEGIPLLNTRCRVLTVDVRTMKLSDLFSSKTQKWQTVQLAGQELALLQYLT